VSGYEFALMANHCYFVLSLLPDLMLSDYRVAFVQVEAVPEN
jgi:hypothetical protein